MTSLAAQLKQLAVPDAQISLSADIKQASFLFDDKEAAKYDKQFFYNIGVNGLQQLITKDERFIEFETNLFSPSSQSIQRLMQTSEVNKKLDETIKRFLLMVSPYMQLREAHKAIEWLVNRYNIHLRNVDAFMMCLLPFHDQEPFILGLRLLNMSSKSCKQWRWLESVKNADTYLPQKTLISHCRSTNGFMGFICNMLAKHIEVNRDSAGKPSAKHLARVISFFTQTVLGAILDGTPSEQFISVLIPTLSAGFKATDLRDYTVSSYMIFSQLVTSCTFTESLLTSMLNVICKNIVTDLLQSALSVVILIFQKQEIRKISKKALKYLSRNLSLTSVISGLSQDLKIEPFLMPFMSALVSSALRKCSANVSASDSENEDAPRVSYMSLLTNMLTSVSLDKEIVAVVARGVINWFEANFSSDSMMETDDEPLCRDGPFQIFKLLEQKYASALEATILDMLSSDESGEKKKVIENLQHQSVATAQREMRSDPLTFMTVCLHHHQSAVRKKAVQQLLQDSQELQDKETLQSAILLRLQDDSSEVVEAVLQDPKGLSQLFEDKQLLYSTIVKKLEAIQGSDEKSIGLVKKLLEVVCCIPKTPQISMTETSVLIISYLVLCSTDEIELYDILNLDFPAFSPLLLHIQKGLQSEIKTKPKKSKGDVLFSGVTTQLVDLVASYLVKQEPVLEMTSMYKCAYKTPRAGCTLMVMALVNLSLIGKVKGDAKKTALQKLLVSSIKHLTLLENFVNLEKAGTVVDKSVEAVVSSCLSQLRESSQLDISLVTYCVNNLDLKGIPATLKDNKFWQLSNDQSVDSNWLWTEITLFNFILELSENSNEHISNLSKKMFSKMYEILGDVSSLMKILCLLWVSKTDKNLTVAHQARGLQFADVFLQTLSSADKTKLIEHPGLAVLPCLMVLMCGKSQKARRVSFNLLDTLSGSRETASDIFNWFASKLLKYRHEVENDVAFVSQVMQNILEEGSELEPPATKRRKSSKPPLSAVGLHYLMDILVGQSTPSVIRLTLLNTFTQLDSTESFEPLMGFLDVLLGKSSIVETLEEKAAFRSSIHLILPHITPSVAQSITLKSNSLKVIQKALNNTDMVLASGESVQILTAAQLTRRFMSSLPSGSCQVIFSQLLDIMATSRITAMVRSCRKVIKHMKLPSKLITSEMTNVLSRELAATVRETKKQKVQSTTAGEEMDVLESKQWKRIIILLEIIQNKKRIIDAEQLIPVAFQVLGRVLEVDKQASGEYIKQLLLGVIFKICSSNPSDEDVDNKESAVSGEHLNMEVIVQCIRSSDNPHTHHQALLLLSAAAKIAPNLLLHNMMTVFTFMGANILRQDDEYSFLVIERILENVIPAIKMACEEKSKETGTPKKKKKASKPENSEDSSEDTMTVMLRVFVDAIPHIPAHRKIMLFQKLITVVGVDSYLWRVVLLVIESVVHRPKAAGSEQFEEVSGPLPESDLEFLTSLCETFSSLDYFECVTSAVEYVMRLPEDRSAEIGDKALKKKEDIKHFEDMKKDDMEIFSIAYNSDKQLRHFKYGTVFALAHLMENQHLVAQLSREDPEDFLQQYQNMMETVLQFIAQVTKSHDEHQLDASSRFWKIFVHKCHDLMDNIVNLLPDSMFLKVVSGLMEHSLTTVQKRSMDLLNTKLQYYKDNGVHPEQRELLLSIVTKLQNIVKQSLLQKSKIAPKDEDVINGQTAIYGLKVLCRILGEVSQEPFIKVLKLCLKALSLHKDNGTVTASAMLCLAEVVSCAKVHVIDHLQELMPLIIEQLQSPAISGHEVLLLAAIISLQKIIEAVPLFLSPFLPDVIVQICLINSVVDADTHKPVVLQKIQSISSTIAKVTATRTFLPVVKKCFTSLQDRLADCAACLMGMLKDHIDHMSREDMGIFCHDLLKFFLESFSIRTERPKMNLSEVASVEGFVIEAFVSLVFKLSEVQFKPMLLQLYSWATDEDASKDRVLTFYRLCSSLAEKLKNLFTLFAGHILKHSAEILDANNKSKTDKEYFGEGKKDRKKSCQLVEYILGCLQKTFLHDTEGFMNKERFDVVMQPIVDQLENNLGKSKEVNERVETFLVPCIASLAAAARDDSLWKDMNYQILLKTRSNSEKVRMRALSAVDAFHKQLGEDYTQLVAESIPFIAELMEDESDEVEKYTQKVIAAMEISVGENLQEYF